MLIPRADRKAIHEYLFREGVLVAKKDFEQPKHAEIDVKNLYVNIPSAGASRIYT
jgi:small subunit ribosomal protein S10e